MIKKIIILNRYKYFGGTLVLSCLCKTLREMGYDARLYMCEDMPFNAIDEKWFIRSNTKNQILRYLSILCNRVRSLFRINYEFDATDDVSSIDMNGLSFQWNPFFDKDDTVVIYPEVVYGNPLKAKNVVRWMMYHYPYQLYSGAYSKEDLFVAFREVFNNDILNPEQNIFNINYFDSELYHQYNFGERNGNCYILRKGRERDDLPKEFDGPVFDDNMSQKELVKMFNEHKYCYSYDTQTFYTTIAAVCGCIPIVMLEPGKTIDDYFKGDDTHYGVAYGNTPEQIEFALSTRDIRIQSLDFSENNKKEALRFIGMLEKRFGKIYSQNV